MLDHTKQQREDSGEVCSKDPLVNLLYTLMRDHLSLGVVEQMVLDAADQKEKDCLYTKGWLVEYAKNLAKRLQPVPPPLPKRKPELTHSYFGLKKEVMRENDLPDFLR